MIPQQHEHGDENGGEDGPLGGPGGHEDIHQAGNQHKQHAWRALYYRNDSSRGTSINEEKEGLELNTVSDVVIPA